MKIDDVVPFQPSDRTNFKKMLKGELLCWILNRTPLWRIRKRNRIIRWLLGSIQGNAYAVQVPFHCCFGCNVHVGKNFFANYNCVLMDHLPIHIGDNVLIAPNVTITTASHPMHADDRRVKHYPNSFEPEGRGNMEVCGEVRIGNNVWIATGCVICPGVTIGDNTVIGANSVVTRDIPSNVFAYGAPCKVIREITDQDKLSEK